MSDTMLELDIQFPVQFELHYWRTALGWRVRGF